MGRLNQKNALVIGGTHGMGLATAKALVAEGARVIVTGANPTNVQKARQELEGQADALGSDIARAQDREALAATVAERLQSLDALFIFAAVAEFAPFDQVCEDSFDRQFATPGAHSSPCSAWRRSSGMAAR